MEKLIEILKEIREDVDYTTCTTLIDDGIFDSFDIIQTINELNEAFEIEILATEIIPENFNSAQTLWDMICRLREE